MAAKLVTKWKKIVKANKDVAVEKASTSGADVKKEKLGANNVLKGSNSSVLSENKKESISELSKKEKVIKSATVTSSDAPTGFNSTTVSSTVAKIRPKAKAKISKPRSTGLEGDGDEIVAAAPVKKKSAPTQQQQPTTFDNSILGDILAASTLPPKIQAKRSVMLSDSFMDALEDKAVAPKRPKIVRKKLTPSQPSKPPPSEETQKLIKTLSPTMEQTMNTTIEEQNFARRKVRFADEKGSELVAIRFFEIEQGERVNVTRMSSEDMKHFEMQRERTFIREQKGFHFLPSNLPMPQGFGGMTSGFHYQHQQKQSAHRWKLIKVDNISEMIEPGCNSEMKHIELRRQATVMEAFYDSFTSLQVSEIDEEDKPRVSSDYAPKLIPLEAATFGDDDSLQSSGGSDTNSNGNVVASVTTTSTTTSAIGNLPLPFTSASVPSSLLTTTTASSIPSNLSRLASQLPPAVAALVSGMHGSAGDAMNLVDSGKKRLSVDSSSAKSGSDDDLESPRSPDTISAGSTKKATKTLEDDDDEFEFSLRSPGDENNDDDTGSVLGPPDSPDDTDIRSLSDQEMEDKDIRQGDGDSRSRAGGDVRMDYEDEDTDIRFGQLGNVKLIPSTPVTASSSIADSKSTLIKANTESGGSTPAAASKSSSSNDVKMDADGLKSMMDSLKKSGLMSSTNLASILGKVQNIGSIGRSTSSASSSSLAGNMSFSGIVDAPAVVSTAATTVSSESTSATSNIVPLTNPATSAPYDQQYGVGGVRPPPFMPQQRGAGAMFSSRGPPSRYPIVPPRGGVLQPHLQPPLFRGRFPPLPRVRPPSSTYGPGGTMGFFGSPTTALSSSGYHATPSRVGDGDGGSSFFNPPPVATRTNANNALPPLSPPRLLQSIPALVRSVASSSSEKSDVVAQPSRIDNNTTHNVTALSFGDEDMDCRNNDNKVGSGGKANIYNTTVAENKTSSSVNAITTSTTNTGVATYSSTHIPSSPSSTFSISTLAGGVPKIGGDSADPSIQPPGTEETALDTDKKQPDDFNGLMPLARTFVKQCTYYMSGGCHFGEGCRFAHGDEITLGLRQAVMAIRNGHAGGGGFCGGGRGVHHGGHYQPYPPRGGGGAHRGGGPMVSAVGGGVELDYNSRENKIRTWKVPPTHIMVTDSAPISRGGGRGRRFSPPFRRSYDNRYGGRQRRSRSRSASISPVRTRRSGVDEISHSRSRSPRGSRSNRRSRGGGSRSPDYHHHSGKTSRRRRSHSSSSRDSRSDEKRRAEGGGSRKKYSSSRYWSSTRKRTSSSRRTRSSSSSSSTAGSSAADISSAAKGQTGNLQLSASPSTTHRRRQRSNSNSSSNDDKERRKRSIGARSDRETEARQGEKPNDRRMKDDESEEDGGADSARLKPTKVEGHQESPSSSSSETIAGATVGGSAVAEETL